MRMTAINKVTEQGEKNVALVLEYDKPICSEFFDESCFSVFGREIKKARISDRMELTDDGASQNGRYVILELDHSDDSAKTLPFEWEVKARRKIEYEVQQHADLRYCDNTRHPAAKVTLEAKEVVNDEYDSFTPGLYEDVMNGARLAYMLYVPENYDPKVAYPLVTYWHGGGEKGDNNLKSMLNTLNAVAWASRDEQMKHPCFVLVPQCPVDGDWIDPDTYQTTDVFDAVLRLLFSVIDQYHVDLSRVYCTGFSMGGMAAWESTKRHPRLFAATIVFAGQDNYEGLERIKGNNLWVFHGEDDDKAMPGNVENIETLENAGAAVNRAYWDGALRGDSAVQQAKEQIAKGGNILHTLYYEGSTGGRPHEYGWAPAVTNEAVRDWLFSHSNPNPSFAAENYTTPAEHVPTKVELNFDGAEVKQIACGNRHSVAVLKDGRVYAWGFNCTGQVGNGKAGAFSDQRTPLQVGGLANIECVAAGNNFSLAVDSSGDVFAWGGNTSGQIGDADTTKLFLTPTRIEGISGVKEVDAGDNYVIALKTDGTVWAWGANINGQLGNGTYTRSSVPIQVEDPDDPSGFLSEIIHIEVGVRTVVAVKADGTIRCWGDGEYGQIGKGIAMHGPGTPYPFKSLDKSDPSGYLNNVRGVAEGRCFTAVMKDDMTVYSWGLNRHGELGLGDYKPELDPSDSDVTPDFLTTVVQPVKIEGLREVVKISAGMNHTVALKKDGSVWTWGYNKLMGSGVLGAGRLDGSNVPIRVANLDEVRDIFVGFNHNFAIKKDGSIWAWGNANNGRLGNVL